MIVYSNGVLRMCKACARREALRMVLDALGVEGFRMKVCPHVPQTTTPVLAPPQREEGDPR